MNCRYVTKSEVKERKKYLEKVIPIVRKKFKEKYNFSFTYMIVGSAKRNLIVQQGNSLWDIDYQFYFPGLKIHEKNSISVKKDLKNILQKELGDRYSVKYSRSVITIVEKVSENTFDIAIIKNDKDNNGMEILRGTSENSQDSNCIKWEQLSDHRNYYKKFRDIKGQENWGEFREKFLEKKCNEMKKDHNEQKETISVLFETINEFSYEVNNEKDDIWNLFNK